VNVVTAYICRPKAPVLVGTKTAPVVPLGKWHRYEPLWGLQKRIRCGSTFDPHYPLWVDTE
jgi:hypothetical protein